MATKQKFTRYTVCSHCGKRTPVVYGSIKKHQEKVIKWLLQNKELWLNKKLEKYQPMQVSNSWAILAYALKLNRLYKWSYCNWDMKLDVLTQEAKIRLSFEANQ